MALAGSCLKIAAFNNHCRDLSLAAVRCYRFFSLLWLASILSPPTLPAPRTASNSFRSSSSVLRKPTFRLGSSLRAGFRAVTCLIHSITCLRFNFGALSFSFRALLSCSKFCSLCCLTLMQHLTEEPSGMSEDCRLADSTEFVLTPANGFMEVCCCCESLISF